jgi:hypothetical protein
MPPPEKKEIFILQDYLCMEFWFSYSLFVDSNLWLMFQVSWIGFIWIIDLKKIAKKTEQSWNSIVIKKIWLLFPSNVKLVQIFWNKYFTKKALLSFKIIHNQFHWMTFREGFFWHRHLKGIVKSSFKKIRFWISCLMRFRIFENKDFSLGILKF